MENNDTSGLNKEEMAELMKDLGMVWTENDWDALEEEKKNEENL